MRFKTKIMISIIILLISLTFLINYNLEDRKKYFLCPDNSKEYVSNITKTQLFICDGEIFNPIYEQNINKEQIEEKLLDKWNN